MIKIQLLIWGNRKTFTYETPTHLKKGKKPSEGRLVLFFQGLEHWSVELLWKYKEYVR
jgi:hypothetical protein